MCECVCWYLLNLLRNNSETDFRVNVMCTRKILSEVRVESLFIHNSD